MLGQKVNAKFRCVNEATNDWEYVIDDTEIIGIVKSTIVGTTKLPKEGTEQKCIILWIDYSNNLVFLSNKSVDMEHISSDINVATHVIGQKGVNAKVLFKNESIFVCSLKKGKYSLVYCPTQLHLNDFENIASSTVAEGKFCKLTFIHNTKPIAVLGDVCKLWQEINTNRKRKTSKTKEENLEVETKKIKLKVPEKVDKKMKTKVDRKRKVSETKMEESIEIEKVKDKKMKEENDTDSDNENDTSLLFYEDKKPANNIIKVATLPVKEDPKTSKNSKPQIQSLTGVSDFWSTDLTNISTNIASSDEEEDDEQVANDVTKSQAKKKLTAAEKFKQQRGEESRLRAIEEKYADPNQLPDSVDQFDRLVLSDPNNSKHWINYMVFHLQSTEIDKARAVARRALKTITFRNSDDQLNIWIALLNLELRYGSKESYNEVLKEALMYNEPLKVYLRTVEIITDAQKTPELIEVIGNITKKFKTEQEVWRVSATAFFSVGMTERAQQLLHKALTCLPERDHVNTIVMFANLNHKHGNSEMAQTLLDQVVTSYPKRVDVWCQYVDMLVKEDLIDSARNILERAVVQKIPLRKMRTIFKKYLEFEERFGNDTNVQRVKKLATDFVKKNETL